MAKVMTYTDPNTGAVYPQSTWLPLGIYIDFTGPSAKVDFVGYATPQVAAAALAHAVGLPGGVRRGAIGLKSYTLTPEQVREFAASPAGAGSLLGCLSQKCYEIAAGTLDTPDPADPAGPKVSFFRGAADLVLL